jgi:transcriptional regulator with XRE-family HTH domain
LGRRVRRRVRQTVKAGANGRARGITVDLERVVAARRQAGLTQEQAALALRTNIMTISRIETGKRRPSAGLAQDMALQYSTTVAYLQGLPDSRPLPIAGQPAKKQRVMRTEEYREAPETVRRWFAALYRDDRHDTSEECWMKALLIGLELNEMGMFGLMARCLDFVADSRLPKKK